MNTALHALIGALLTLFLFIGIPGLIALAVTRLRTPAADVRTFEASPYARHRDTESDELWRELDQLRHPSNRVYNHQEDGLG